MADINDGEVELEGYYRNQLDLKVTVRVGADDLTEMLTALPDDHRRHVLDELSQDPDLVGEMFEKLDDDEQVDVAHDHMDLNQIELVLRRFTDDERRELFHSFCIHCGSEKDPCFCMRDD